MVTVFGYYDGGGGDDDFLLLLLLLQLEDHLSSQAVLVHALVLAIPLHHLLALLFLALVVLVSLLWLVF